MRCVAYAMGGGRGHQTRARNLHRALKRLEPAVQTFLCVPEDRVAQVEPGLTMLVPPSREPKALTDWIATILERYRPHLFLVDTFPRGVLGEMSGLRFKAPSVLITRWVAPAYYQHPPVRRALESFEAVFWTEPKSDPSFPGELTEPVVDDRPVLSRAEARQALGVGENPLILALPWTEGLPWRRSEESLRALCSRRGWELRVAGTGSPYDFSRADRYLSGADLVLSASGYNAYYEVTKHHRPALWVPQPRKTDDQALRASGAFDFRNTAPQGICQGEPTETQMEALLPRKPVDPSQTPPTPQGAMMIAERLQRLAGVAR